MPPEVISCLVFELSTSKAYCIFDGFLKEINKMYIDLSRSVVVETPRKVYVRSYKFSVLSGMHCEPSRS